MANTYTQIHIQFVFAVKGRNNLIASINRETLHQYMTGIVQNRGQKLLAIFCMPDHAHLLVGMRPNISMSDLVRDIKTGSTNFINGEKWVKGKFSWQEGFGAFSYSKSHVENVIAYILNQEVHHQKRTFREEYLDFLKKFEVDYDPQYLFDWLD